MKDSFGEILFQARLFQREPDEIVGVITSESTRLKTAFQLGLRVDQGLRPPEIVWQLLGFKRNPHFQEPTLLAGEDYDWCSPVLASISQPATGPRYRLAVTPREPGELPVPPDWRSSVSAWWERLEVGCPFPELPEAEDTKGQRDALVGALDVKIKEALAHVATTCAFVQSTEPRMQAPAEGGAEPKRAKKVTSREIRAYQAYEAALEAMGEDATQAEAYKWIKGHLDFEQKDTLPSLETWCRYVRSGKNGHQPSLDVSQEVSRPRSAVPLGAL